MKKISYKLIPIILILIAFSYTILHSNNVIKASQNSNSTFVTAIGFDTVANDDNKVNISFQITTFDLNNISNYTSKVVSITDSSLDNSLNKLYANTEIIPDFSHISAIIFSEDISKKGINKYIESFSNNYMYNSNMNILVSKSTASDYLKSISAIKEINPTEFFKNFEITYANYSNAKPLTVAQFIKDKDDLTKNSVSFLCDIVKSTPNTSSDSSVNIYSDNNLISNYPYMSGLAVFNKDKLVGNIQPDDVIYYLIFNSKLKLANIHIDSNETTNTEENLETGNENTVENSNEKNTGNQSEESPQNSSENNSETNNQNSTEESAENSNENTNGAIETSNELEEFDISISQRQNLGITHNTSNNQPYINIVIPLNVEILNKFQDIQNNETKNVIYKALEKKLYNYLYITQKDLELDINDFGKYFKTNFNTIEEFKRYNWNEKYKTAKIEFKLDLNFL